MTTELEYLETQVVDPTKLYFSVRFGQEAKMYTLWRIQPLAIFKPESFVKNLSTEYGKALLAAKAKCKEVPFIVEAPEDLNDIVRGQDVLRFGKYKGKRISEINDDRYLTWIWEGGPVPSERNRDENKYLIDKDTNLWRETQELLLSKGVLVDYNDRILTARHADRLKEIHEQNAKSDFVGTVGEKVTLTATFERFSSYDNGFGTTYIQSFRDSDGNVIVYKGVCLEKPVIMIDSITGVQISSADRKAWKNLLHIEVRNGEYHNFHGMGTKEVLDMIKEVDYKGQHATHLDSKTKQFYNFDQCTEPFLEKGDTVALTGTIKEHSEYNGTKQTVLQRVKIIG